MRRFQLFLILITMVCFAGFAQQKGTIRSFASGIDNNNIAIDPSGNLWITNPTAQSVTEVTPGGSVIRIVNLINALGLAPGQWEGPFSIAADPFGNVWVPIKINMGKFNCTRHPCPDQWQINAIKIAPTGLIAENYTVSGGLTDEWAPHVKSDSAGNVFVSTASDSSNSGIIVKFDRNGVVQGIVKIGCRIYDMAIDPQGAVWASNVSNDNIYGVSPAGSVLGPLNTRHASTGIAVDQSGNLWLGGNAHEIEKLSPSGDVLAVTPIQNNTWDGPHVIRIDGTGNVWAINQMSQPNQGASVIELNPQGTIIATYPMPNPIDLAIDKQGNVWVTNSLMNGNNLYEIVGVADDH